MSVQNQKNLSESAQVDQQSVQPFPRSQKVYVQGSRPDIRVPMREISLDVTPTAFGGEINAPVTVYDTSGPYTDPNVQIDVRKGLADVRSAWIEDRGDTEKLPGLSSEFGQRRLNDAELSAMRFAHVRNPRRAKPGKNVSQMHYAKQGIITPEMEYVAIRENMKLAEAREAGLLKEQHAGQSFGASHPQRDHRRVRAQRNRPRPRHHPGQHQPRGAGADDHRPQLPGEDQRQHRQLGAGFFH